MTNDETWLRQRAVSPGNVRATATHDRTAAPPMSPGMDHGGVPAESPKSIDAGCIAALVAMEPPSR